MNKKVTIVTFLIPSLHQSIYFSIYLFPPNLRNSEIPLLPQGVACFYYVVPSLHVSNHHHRQDILLYFTSYASTPAEIAPLFLFFFSSLSTVRASHIALRAREREREKNAWKILPPCGPTTILPLLPSIRAIHTCTCRRIVDKKPVTYPRGWKKNWWKIARGRRDTDSFSFFSLLFISSFFSLLSTGRIYRFPLSLSLSPPTKRTSWRTLGKKKEKKFVRGEPLSDV